jgi:hypothetical protein
MKTLKKTLEMLASFEPETSKVFADPPGTGTGFWAGGCFATPREDGISYVYFRLRRPRGEPAERRRGYECRIVRLGKRGGVKKIWAAQKQDFGARSIEKGCLARRDDGTWLLYVSYESETTGRWQIDVISADSPERFDPAKRREFLRGEAVGAEHIKDPHVVVLDGRLHVFANATIGDDAREATLLALSERGENVDAIEKWILVPPEDRSRWDAASSRLTGLLPLSDGWLMFYDGRRVGGEVCEENCGLCYAPAIAGPYKRLTGDAPFRERVRYLQGNWRGGRLELFYEATRATGEHVLGKQELK